jgi:hypothetical protein
MILQGCNAHHKVCQRVNLLLNVIAYQNNDENFFTYFLKYVMMSAIILQNFNLSLHLCMDK